MSDPITDPALNTLLAAGWTKVDGREAIEKEFRFKGFRRAFGFMAAVATKADQLNHHPEWSNVYNRVQVLLTTHDAGGLTNLDAQLGAEIERIAADIIAAPTAPALTG